MEAMKQHYVGPNDTIEVEESLLVLAPMHAEASEKIESKNTSFWREAWINLRKNKLAIAGLVFIVGIVIMSIIGPYLNGGADYAAQDLANSSQLPNGTDWFGTDDIGRSLWVRTWYGARISLFIAVTVAMIELAIGTTYGGISGFYGGTLDIVMQRISEIISSIPSLVLLTLLLVVFKPSIPTIIFAVSFTSWVGMSRVVRSQILKYKEYEFILAARTLGASNGRLIFKHLVPNVVGQLIVVVSFSIPSTIFFESFLAFLGLGLPAPLPSLGILISDGFKSMLLYPHMLLIPALVLTALMISFNLLGNGLRDAFDPKMK
ncbi:MAG: ABC transporter permease [Culicoidibacterales bacterium]